MINSIKRYIPKSLKKSFKSKFTITKPKIAAPITNSNEVLGGLIAYNIYGGYFTPLSATHRPAVQKILKGDVFEPETIQFIIDNCGEGDIIHAGTFFGDFLPGISSGLVKGSKVWAFEPNIESFRCAQITSLINNLENVELMNSGLGDKKTTAKMLVKMKSGGELGGASKIITEDKKGRTIDVDINLIDDVVPNDRKVSIIQLDVEGYEQQALTGALKTINRCKPILILEDNDNVIETKWFENHILKLGYEVNRRIHENTLLTIKTQHNLKS